MDVCLKVIEKTCTYYNCVRHLRTTTVGKSYLIIEKIIMTVKLMEMLILIKNLHLDMLNSSYICMSYLPLPLMRPGAVAPSLDTQICTNSSRTLSSEQCGHKDYLMALGGQTEPRCPPTSPEAAMWEVDPYSQSHPKSTAFPSQGYLLNSEIFVELKMFHSNTVIHGC